MGLEKQHKIRSIYLFNDDFPTTSALLFVVVEDKLDLLMSEFTSVVYDIDDLVQVSLQSVFQSGLIFERHEATDFSLNVLFLPL